MSQQKILSDKELKRVRQLAALIRDFKEKNYHSITWDATIDKILSENCLCEDDFFRTKALMVFFIAEDKQLCSLEHFLNESFEPIIAKLKKQSRENELQEIEKQTPKPTLSIGNTEAECPYCQTKLDKFPGRKKKCPECGQFIYVRTRPGDDKRILVTFKETEEIERLYEKQYQEQQQKEELARHKEAEAYMQKRYREYMKEKHFKYLKIRLSGSHTGHDICDTHANANLYGMGPGIYPKEKAPVPPFHIGCKCTLNPLAWPS